MPNLFDATGLQVSTRAELIATFTSKYQSIYGTDIVLSSDSPDGQMMNVYIQSVLDTQDLLVQIWNSFNPDNAYGTTLDQRVAINGIQRQAGTYSQTPITIVNSQSINLYGLDQTAQGVYTVQDNAGNQWQLLTTQLGVTAGTHVYTFQSAVPGAQLTIPNTIVVPNSIILGVTSINNPGPQSVIGINEESDALLKIRRAKSVSLSSQGYLTGLLAALQNITGVTSAYVYENVTGSTNSDGVPGHSIWVIVAGTAAASAIAQAIYTKRNAGCGMFGSVSYNVVQVDGSIFPVYWDVVVTRNLFISFTATSINGVAPPNITAIRAGLSTFYIPVVNGTVDINTLANYVKQIDANCLVTNAGFSSGETQVLNLSGVPASGAFILQYNGNSSAAINWNDTTAAIQTKLRAVTGLSLINVTGTLASQTLTLDLTGVGGTLGLIFVTTNSLATAGSAAITFSYQENFISVLVPTNRKNQFVISSPNIIITPMQLTPFVSSVTHGTTAQYATAGGYGTYTYSMAVNNSGGSIGASSGVYTAGAVSSVTDTLKVTDSLGNTATATVSVT